MAHAKQRNVLQPTDLTPPLLPPLGAQCSAGLRRDERQCVNAHPVTPTRRRLSTQTRRQLPRVLLVLEREAHHQTELTHLFLLFLLVRFQFLLSCCLFRLFASLVQLLRITAS